MLTLKTIIIDNNGKDIGGPVYGDSGDGAKLIKCDQCNIGILFSKYNSDIVESTYQPVCNYKESIADYMG